MQGLVLSNRLASSRRSSRDKSSVPRRTAAMTSLVGWESWVRSASITVVISDALGLHLCLNEVQMVAQTPNALSPSMVSAEASSDVCPKITGCGDSGGRQGRWKDEAGGLRGSSGDRFQCVSILRAGWCWGCVVHGRWRVRWAGWLWWCWTQVWSSGSPSLAGWQW